MKYRERKQSYLFPQLVILGSRTDTCTEQKNTLTILGYSVSIFLHVHARSVVIDLVVLQYVKGGQGL